MNPTRLGARLRALRTASGRTVASVAVEAGLSVPYISNLENGRGNPTTSTLSRLAHAFDSRLLIDFVPPTAEDDRAVHPSAELVRFSRGPRFRKAVHAIAERLDRAPDELSAELTAWLAQLSRTLGREVGPGDLDRLLDAVLLIVAHPRDTG